MLVYMKKVGRGVHAGIHEEGREGVHAGIHEEGRERCACWYT